MLKNNDQHSSSVFGYMVTSVTVTIGNGFVRKLYRLRGENILIL